MLLKQFIFCALCQVFWLNRLLSSATPNPVQFFSILFNCLFLLSLPFFLAAQKLLLFFSNPNYILAIHNLPYHIPLVFHSVASPFSLNLSVLYLFVVFLICSCLFVEEAKYSLKAAIVNGISRSQIQHKMHNSQRAREENIPLGNTESLLLLPLPNEYRAFNNCQRYCVI